MKRKSPFCTLNLSSGDAPPAPVVCPARSRLEQAFARLENIQLVRNHRQDPLFGRSAENGIVWRELLELEFQEVDVQLERIERLRAAAEELQ